MRRAPVIALLVAAFSAAPLHAETELLGDVASEVKDALKESLLDADTLNSLLQPLVEKSGNGALGFLDDFGLQFKWFDATDTSEKPSLGIAYEFGKQIEDWDLSPAGDAGAKCGETCRRVGVAIDFSARGSVAFEQSANPDDFLDTSLSTGIFTSLGGPVSQTPEWRRAYEEIGQRIANETDEANLPALEEELHAHVANALKDHFFGELLADVSYESNQDFSARQLAYSLRLGLEIKGWEDLHAGQFGETRWLSRLNLFDYPFAALRYMTKSEDCAPDLARCFIPRGRTLPGVIVGIGLVDPSEDDDRQAAGGDLDSFPRVDLEIAFKTLAFEMGGTNVDFTASYRLFQEIGADRAVRSAGLDDFDYLALTLGPTNGPFVSYATGQLPFDQRSQQVFEVGLRADFDAIKEFFLN